MNYKKALAAVLAAAMAMGSVTVFASADSGTVDSTETPAATDSGTGSSVGTLEGTVDRDVFSVVLPTVSTGTLNFIADPEGLIEATGGARINNATFEAGASLLFANVTTDADGNSTTSYSSTSDKLTAINKSSQDVSVSVTAEVTTAGDNVGLSTDSTFADASGAAVYLALTDGTNVSAVGDSTAAEITTRLSDASDAYEVSYDSSNGYTYAIPAASTYDSYDEYTFYLTGTANTLADWSEVTTLPTVDVTWTLTAIDTPTYSKTTGLDLQLATEGKAVITSVKYGVKGAVTNAADGYTYDATTATVTLPAGLFGAAKAGDYRYVEVTFGNGTTETARVLIAD